MFVLSMHFDLAKEAIVLPVKLCSSASILSNLRTKTTLPSYCYNQINEKLTAWSVGLNPESLKKINQKVVIRNPQHFV